MVYLCIQSIFLDGQDLERQGFGHRDANKSNKITHIFHENCLKEWVQRNENCPTCPTCPICRKNIDPNVNRSRFISFLLGVGIGAVDQILLPLALIYRTAKRTTEIAIQSLRATGSLGIAIEALQAGRLVFQWATSTDGTYEKIILKIFTEVLMGVGFLNISFEWLRNENDNTSRVMIIVRGALFFIGALFLGEGLSEGLSEGLDELNFFKNQDELKLEEILAVAGVIHGIADRGWDFKEAGLLGVAGITIYQIIKIEGAVALIQNLAGIGLTGAMMGKVVANCSIRLRNLLIGRQQGEESFRARALRVALVAAVAFIAGALMATTLQIAPLIGGVMAVAGSILGTRDLAPQRLEQAHQGIAQQFGWSSKKIEILFLGANLGIALMVALKISGMELPFYVLPLVTGALATVNW